VQLELSDHELGLSDYSLQTASFGSHKVGEGMAFAVAAQELEGEALALFGDALLRLVRNTCNFRPQGSQSKKVDLLGPALAKGGAHRPDSR
jgi:hypothetical protein